MLGAFNGMAIKQGLTISLCEFTQSTGGLLDLKIQNRFLLVQRFCVCMTTHTHGSQSSCVYAHTHTHTRTHAHTHTLIHAYTYVTPIFKA